MYADICDYYGFLPSTTDEELEVIRTSKQMETDESKPVSNVGKEQENARDKSALVDNKEIHEKMPEESVKAVRMEEGMAKPASGKDDELYSNEGVIEDQKQEEPYQLHEK